MRFLVKSPVGLGLALLLVGCTVMPNRPNVMALPGTGKSFEQFRIDDFQCRDFALAQIGGRTAEQAAADAGVRSAAVGAAVGALAGAAIGGHESAGAGAGAGLIVGSVAGAGAAQQSAQGTQAHYDMAYVQCMYAKGHRVPVVAGLTDNAAPRAAFPPPPPGYPPPPPRTPGR